LRRAPSGREVPLRHVPLHGDRRGQGLDRTRGHGLEDRRRAALLSHEPRNSGGRGGRDDREWIHRADHEGAANGVRGRDEPPHSTSDGRIGRLSRREPIRRPQGREPVNETQTLMPGLNEPSGLPSWNGARVAERSRSAGEPAFLTRLRAEAWAHAEKTPFPARTEELWRRTDISGLSWDSVLVDREHPALRSSSELPAAARDAI